jgi:hypothetical protein
MTPARALEFRITRKLVQGRKAYSGSVATRLAETVIRVLAAIAVVVLLGAQLPELLWAGMAASVVYTLGLS